jgi:hypothetical protein
MVDPAPKELKTVGDVFRFLGNASPDREFGKFMSDVTIFCRVSCTPQIPTGLHLASVCSVYPPPLSCRPTNSIVDCDREHGSFGLPQ